MSETTTIETTETTDRRTVGAPPITLAHPERVSHDEVDKAIGELYDRLYGDLPIGQRYAIARNTTMRSRALMHPDVVVAVESRRVRVELEKAAEKEAAAARREKSDDKLRADSRKNFEAMHARGLITADQLAIMLATLA